jgi:hypothetical protein
VLGPLFDAFAELGVATERIVYADDAIDELRDQLQRVDGVLVWVNPIQDGANRAQLDNLIREVPARGVWVCAHPDVDRSSPCGQGGARVSTTRQSSGQRHSVCRYVDWPTSSRHWGKVMPGP